MSLGLLAVLFEYVVLMMAICIHDAAQAWMAWRLGDPTAKMLGRLTLNPAKHFNWFGCGLWPLIYAVRGAPMIGFGNAVPITGRNFKKWRRDETIAILAGPVANLLCAVLCLALLVAFKHAGQDGVATLDAAMRIVFHDRSVNLENTPAVFPVILLLYFGVFTSLMQFVFNLLPLPYLDGGKLLREFLPYNAKASYDQLAMPLMIGFMLMGGLVIGIFFSPLLMLFNRLLGAM